MEPYITFQDEYLSIFTRSYLWQTARGNVFIDGGLLCGAPGKRPYLTDGRPGVLLLTHGHWDHIGCDSLTRQLGGSVEFTEAVALGEVESCMVGFDGLGNLVPSMYALCMPYLYSSIDEMRPILEGDTTARASVDGALAESNMMIAGILYRPFRVMANNKISVKSPADLAGVVVRSPSSEANTAIIEGLGAEPTTISWSEVYTAMQQGACDGVENAITELKSINLEQVTKYVSETNHMAAGIPIIVAKGWFEGLTAEQQEAIMKAGAEVTEWRAAGVKEEEAAAWKAFEDAGAECLRMEDIDFAAFQDSCKDVYKKFVDKGYFTEEFFASLKG